MFLKKEKSKKEVNIFAVFLVSSFVKIFRSIISFHDGLESFRKSGEYNQQANRQKTQKSLILSLINISFFKSTLITPNYNY